jgi:hypothetical protein
MNPGFYVYFAAVGGDLSHGFAERSREWCNTRCSSHNDSVEGGIGNTAEDMQVRFVVQRFAFIAAEYVGVF